LSQYIPEKGDIVWLNFDPSIGSEIIKRRPAFVISRLAFNSHTDLAIVAPITSRVRGIKLEVVLPDELNTQGAVLVYQLKALDFMGRDICFIEKAPAKTTEMITNLAKLIIS
jgi:mRNA-degrading endonuclease toxin of MazEF toxin-antitoxin module